MFYMALGMILLGFVGILVERAGRRRGGRIVQVNEWRDGSPTEAHYHVHEVGNRHIGIRVRPPVDFEQSLSLQQLEYHAEDARIDLSSCVRKPGGGGGAVSGGGGGGQRDV